MKDNDKKDKDDKGNFGDDMDIHALLLQIVYFLGVLWAINLFLNSLDLV